MNETKNSPDCERASDLIAFLYNEASEHERRDFESHLKVCRVCYEEAASFGVVRDSITTWRDEVLSGFVSSPVPGASRKSALAAFRHFFDLSPLWLKGVTAFAALALCGLAALAIVRLQTNNRHKVSIDVNQDKTYTAQDVERIVKEAVAKQQNGRPPSKEPEIVKTSQSPRSKVSKSTSNIEKSRRPLSRAEREQLAVDLRLVSTTEDVDLRLLGDRINQ